MRPSRSIAVLALLPALLAAQQQAPPRVKVVEPTAQDQTLPSISLLPVGAVLRDVMIPRYDKQRQLTSCLRSELITLVSENTVETRKVHLEFFGPGRTPRGFIDLKLAYYDQSKGTLRATEAVDIQAERFSAQGSGLVYHIRQGKGFLNGPVTTLAQGLAPTPPTSMKLSPKSTAAATAAAAMIATAAQADPPQRLTDAQRAALEQSAVSAAPAVRDAATVAQKQIADSQATSAQTSAEAKEFTQQADIKVSEPAAVPAAKPLEVQDGPQAAKISAADGMYFDAEKGVLVFLKDVTVKDPRFQLSGAQEVKVYFAQKPKAEKDKAKNDGDKPKTGGGMFAGANAEFGDVERIIATGAPLIVAKGQNGEKDVEACAAVFDFNMKTGEAIMHGGFPWVRQGDVYFRSNVANGYVRFPNLNKNPSFITSGPSDSGTTNVEALQSKDQNKKDKKQDGPAPR